MFFPAFPHHSSPTPCPIRLPVLPQTATACADAATALRAQVMAAVQSTVNASLTSESDMLPLSQAVQARLVNMVNGTVNGINDAMQMATNRLSNLVRVEDQVGQQGCPKWRQPGVFPRTIHCLLAAYRRSKR